MIKKKSKEMKLQTYIVLGRINKIMLWLKKKKVYSQNNVQCKWIICGVWGGVVGIIHCGHVGIQADSGSISIHASMTIMAQKEHS